MQSGVDYNKTGMSVLFVSSLLLLIIISQQLLPSGASAAARQSENLFSGWIEQNATLLAFFFDDRSWRDATAVCAEYDASLVNLSDTPCTCFSSF